MNLTPAGAAGNGQNGQILNCSAFMISISVHDNTIDVLETIFELIPEPLLRTIHNADDDAAEHRRDGANDPEHRCDGAKDLAGDEPGHQ